MAAAQALGLRVALVGAVGDKEVDLWNALEGVTYAFTHSKKLKKKNVNVIVGPNNSELGDTTQVPNFMAQHPAVFAAVIAVPGGDNTEALVNHFAPCCRHIILLTNNQEDGTPTPVWYENIKTTHGNRTKKFSIPKRVAKNEGDAFVAGRKLAIQISKILDAVPAPAPVDQANQADKGKGKGNDDGKQHRRRGRQERRERHHDYYDDDDSSDDYSGEYSDDYSSEDSGDYSESDHSRERRAKKVRVKKVRAKKGANKGTGKGRVKKVRAQGSGKGGHKGRRDRRDRQSDSRSGSSSSSSSS